MRILKVAVLAALLVIPAQSVEASVLGQVLTFDGVTDLLQDESRAFQVAGGPAGLVGDEFFGWVQITSAVPFGVLTPPSLVGIFSFTVTGGAGTAASPFTLGPTAGVNSLTSLAPTLTGASGATAAQLASSIFVLGGTAGSFDAPGLSGGAGLAGALAELTAIDTTLSYEATIGLDGIDDFFQAVSVGINFVEDGGFTIFDSSLGTSAQFLPLTGILGGLHDTTLTGIVFGPPGGVPLDPPWIFTDQASFLVNAIPEPTTFVVWGLLGSIAAVACARRRRVA